MACAGGMRVAANGSVRCMMGGWDASAEEGNQYGCSSSSPMVLHEIQVEMAAYQSSIREGKKSMTQAKASPEIGKSIRAGGVLTNYHEAGSGTPVILIHGSGPGVSAWAHWQFSIPYLAGRRHAFAYDPICFACTVPCP